MYNEICMWTLALRSHVLSINNQTTIFHFQSLNRVQMDLAQEDTRLSKVGVNVSW